MGLRDWLKKTRDEFDQAAYYFELGCEVMGEPRSNSLQERSARIAAGKREDARRKEAAAQASKKAHRPTERCVDTAGLQIFVKAAQRVLDERTAEQRRQGHNIKQGPKVMSATFDGKPAIVKFFENGDPNRMDIYYGGEGGNPMTNKEHGHVAVDLRHPENPKEWFLPGPPGQRKSNL